MKPKGEWGKGDDWDCSLCIEVFFPGGGLTPCGHFRDSCQLVPPLWDNPPVPVALPQPRLHRDCCVLNRSLLRLVLGPQQVSQHLSTNVSLLWEASVSIKRAGIEDF